MKPQSLTKVLLKNYSSPVLKVKYCSLAKPFFYPSSPNIPRYSVTCILDPVKDKEFLKVIREIEEKDKIDNSLKDDTQKDRETGEVSTTGRYLIKFSGKEKIPVSYVKNDKALSPDMLVEELKYGTECSVIFDVVQFTKKDTKEKGLSFQASMVYVHDNKPVAEDEEMPF